MRELGESRLALFVLVGLGYAAGSQLAFSWFGADGTTASFFPAAGVTLAALVLARRRRWPIVLAAAGIAEFAVDVAHGIDPAASAGYVLANLAQPLAGALLLLALVRHVDLARSRDLAAFLLAAVLVAPALGGALGASTFVLIDGGSGWARFAAEWWVGDGLGVLVVGGALLSLASSARPLSGGLKPLEAIGIFLGTAVSTIAVFRLDLVAFVYVPIALLVAAAFRLGTRGVAFSGAAMAFIAAEATARGHTFWETLELAPATGLLYLQLALAVIIATTLALAAEINQRERAALAWARLHNERRESDLATARAERLRELAVQLGTAQTTTEISAQLDRDRLGPLSDDALFREAAAQLASHARERVRGHEAEAEGRRRAELLERHAARLAAAATAHDVAHATVDELEGSGIRIAGVELSRGEEIEVLATTGVSGEARERLQLYPRTADTPGAQAIRTGESVEIATGSEYDSRFPETAGLRVGHGVESILAVPLPAAKGRVLGALSAAFVAPNALDQEMRQLIEGISGQCGLALERALLYEAETEARLRAELLERIAADLAAAATPSEVAAATVSNLEAAGLGAAGVTMRRGDSIELLATSARAAEAGARFEQYPLETPTPGAQAIRTGRLVEVSTGAEYDDAYPDTAGIRRELGAETIVAVPLRDAGHEVIGALVVTSPKPRWLDEPRRQLLEGVAGLCGLALERAVLFEGEQEARSRAERLERRAVRLQAVTAALAAAESGRKVATVVVKDLIPALGGMGGSIFVLDGQAGLLRMVEHDSYPEEIIEEYRDIPLDGDLPPADAVRAGKPVLIGNVDEMRSRYPGLIEELDLDDPRYGRAWAHLPLTAGARRIGMLILAYADAQPFDAAQRTDLLSAADAAGQALQRALLFEAEQDARTRSQLLEQSAAHLAAAATLREVGESVVADLEAFGLDVAAVHVRDSDSIQVVAATGTAFETDAHTQVYPYATVAVLPDSMRRGVVLSFASGVEYESSYPEAAAERRGEGSETIVALPLRVEKRVVGALYVASRQAGWLDDSRLQLLMGIAEQCGVALRRAQLQEVADAAAADASFLALVSESLDRAASVSERASTLVELLVAKRTTFAAVHLAQENEPPRLLATAGKRPAGEDADTLTDLAGRTLEAGKVLFPNRSEVPDELPDEPPATFMVLPLRLRDRVLGTLTVETRGRALGLTQAREVASRAAVRIDNALSYEREKSASHALQVGLLGGSLPDLKEAELEAAYRPGTVALEVGGDWYDAFPLPNGWLALAAGDVVGHGLESAIAMGQLRSAVRTLAPLYGPAEVLSHLDDFVATVPGAEAATLAYAELEPATGLLRFACAGHPPPLLVTADGETRYLWEGRSTPLGTRLDSGRTAACAALLSGDTLLLYTDGLVERRGAGLDERFRFLADLVRDLRAQPLDELVDVTLAEMLGGHAQEDDVTLILLRAWPVTTEFRYSLPASAPALAELRQALRAWLARHGVDEAEQAEIVLAIGEAAANSIEHGYGPDEDGKVVVSGSIEGEAELTVVVRDGGTWKEEKPTNDRGRGGLLMRASMDAVEVRRGSGGTDVLMKRRVRGTVPA